MTKLVSIEEIQSVATYNCDQSNKGNKYPDDIIIIIIIIISLY